MTRRQLMAGTVLLSLPVTARACGPPSAGTPQAGISRLEAARRGLEQFDKKGGDSVCARVWARRVAEAELALCGRPAERLAALEEYVRLACEAERVVRAGRKAGALALTEVLEAEFYRADAEALLAEEKARAARG